VIRRLAELAQRPDLDLKRVVFRCMANIAGLDHAFPAAIPLASLEGLRSAYGDLVKNQGFPRNPLLEVRLGITYE
jgi:hypothetical protein